MSLELQQAGQDMARSAKNLARHAVEIGKRSVYIHQKTHTPDDDKLTAAGHMLDPKNKDAAKASLSRGFLEHAEEKGEELLTDAADFFHATGKGVVAVAELAEEKAQEVVGVVSERARRIASVLEQQAQRLLH